MDEDKIKEALFKKAVGFSSNEVVEEYSLDENGNEVLSKRKITRKYNPPDIAAVKILLEKNEIDENRFLNMTSTMLKKEKKRLLKILKEEKSES